MEQVDVDCALSFFLNKFGRFLIVFPFIYNIPATQRVSLVLVPWKTLIDYSGITLFSTLSN